jgi:hypothetical protein
MLAAECFGFYGYLFSDLVTFEYPKPVPKEAQAPAQTEHVRLQFPTLEQALAHPLSALDKRFPDVYFLLQGALRCDAIF